MNRAEEKRKGQFIPPIAFCDAISRRRCEGEGRGGVRGWGGLEVEAVGGKVEREGRE